MDRLIATATIGRTFGYEGEVRVYPNNEESDYLKKLKTIVASLKDGKEIPLAVEHVRTDGKSVLMKFKGYDSSEEAQAIVGARVMVDRKFASPLKEGEYYTADLIGCTLVSDGENRATVVSVMDGPQALLLEAERPDSKRFLVPFLHEYTGKVDLEEKTIELLAPWLLD
ncbi:MAG TPA: ribosome maturation factor RimM [Sphaerochaeta sp.]|nr:16S rRNA processing protein RimM [Spirochaetales bacterium]HQB54361.1 ribosome maturation factor RimM [Sphaerochaeta sp.]